MPEGKSRAERLDELIRKLLRAMSPEGGDPLHDLPLAQLRVVRALSSGPKAAGDVGQELGLSPSALSQIVQRLGSTGLIVKEEDCDDRRVKRLSLSKAGTKQMQARDKLRHAKAAALLDELTDEDQELLLMLLERVAKKGPQGATSTTIFSAGLDKDQPV